MADSTNILNQIVVAQAQPAVPANELFASMSPAALFSRNESASSLLTWAYYGGRYKALTIANGTLALTASQANIYIVALKSTGVVSFATTTTNWNSTTTYDRLYRVTTNATQATVWEDYRELIGNSASGTFVGLSDGPGGFAGNTLKTVRVNAGETALEYTTSSGFTGGTLTSALNEAPIVTIASAATVNIGAAAGNTISVTGTTTITAFDTIAEGAIRRIVFAGILTLTHNGTSLILPTGASITTAAGDVAEFVSLGSGNWRATGYERASGASLAGSGIAWGAITGTLSSQTDLNTALTTIPQNSQSTAYTAVLTDAGKHLLHPSADTTARTFTIPANSSVAFAVGTALTFVNQASAGVMTISITTDTMRLAGAGTTGSRTLAANGIATALKLTSTEWIVSGTSLT